MPPVMVPVPLTIPPWIESGVVEVRLPPLSSVVPAVWVYPGKLSVPVVPWTREEGEEFEKAAPMVDVPVPADFIKVPLLTKVADPPLTRERLRSPWMSQVPVL